MNLQNTKVFETVKRIFNNAIIVTNHADVKEVLKKANTCYYNYIKVCDGVVIACGYSGDKSVSRCKVLFEGLKGAHHLKAGHVALAHVSAEDSIQIIVCYNSKQEAEVGEKELQKILEFNKTETADIKLMSLYDIRLQQININDNEQIFAHILRSLLITQMSFRLLSTGLIEAEKGLPGITAFTKKVFGGYYTDI